MNKQKQSGAKWVSGLDSIRFILAFIVLLSHFENPWIAFLKNSTLHFQKTVGMLIPNLFSGIGAVIAFFIISGFVIHYPNKDGISDVPKFLIRRWLRIAIPLLVVTVLTLYYNCFDSIPIWSLYCELIYYSIYPLLSVIRLSWKLKYILSFAISFICMVIFCKGDMLSLLKQTNDNYSGAYWQLGPFLTWIVGLPCWLLGVLLAENIDVVTRKVAVKKIFFLRITVFTVSVLLNIAKFHLFVSYIFSMNLFALLVYIWIKSEIVYYRERKPVRIVEKMGIFSYSIYLLHGACFIALSWFFTLNNLSYFLFIIATLIISYIFYVIIEKPSHMAAKKIAAWLPKKIFYARS